MENSAVELHPLVRTLVIGMLISVPVLLVILQRLPEIRKFFKQPDLKEKEPWDGHSQFNFGSGREVSICPKCFRQNLPDHRFCGFCGSEITFPKKEN